MVNTLMPNSHYTDIKAFYETIIPRYNSGSYKSARNSMKDERLQDETHKSARHLHEFDLGEDVDAVIGITAAALAGDQVLRTAESEKHKTNHLLKAGVSAAVALGAFKLLHREHDEKHHNQPHRHQHNADHHGEVMHRKPEAGRGGRSSTP